MKKIIRDFIPYLIPAFIVFILLRFVFMLMAIPSSSMENTVMTGDYVIGTRFDTGTIARYDVVAFKSPDNPEKLYIKRVIGLPGETITVSEGKVYADGVLLDDSYVTNSFAATNGDGTYTVPENCYFMMGDNRDHSWDSRYWTNKYVPADSIVAKARWIVFRFSHIGTVS